MIFVLGGIASNGMLLFVIISLQGPVEAMAERHSVEFKTFFDCERGETPKTLIRRGIYNSIAVPLKGGEWRRASMVLVAQGMGGRTGWSVGHWARELVRVGEAISPSLGPAECRTEAIR